MNPELSESEFEAIRSRILDENHTLSDFGITFKDYNLLLQSLPAEETPFLLRLNGEILPILYAEGGKYLCLN